MYAARSNFFVPLVATELASKLESIEMPMSKTLIGLRAACHLV
jgi:hypothetical protein